MADIVLTADRTLMSNYRCKEFLGFATSVPPNVVPDWFFERLFFPYVRERDGLPVEAPYGLRKVEAKLLEGGFDVITVRPDRLGRWLDGAKVLGVHAMDPFGVGPSSSTFSRILKSGEPYLVKHFKAVFQSPAVKRAKARGLRILVGGPGAWQFRYWPEAQDELGIDCVIEGEAENILMDLFRAALEGEELPRFFEVPPSRAPSLEEIPEIRNPSINGLIEIGRGCPRGCAFCSVTLRPLRWYPLEKIDKELLVNSEGGVDGCILHGEDVLLYGSMGVIPRREKVLALHKLAKARARGLSWSHASMAAIATDPRLMEELSEIIIDENQRWWGAEIGIETGSPELAMRVMPAKAKPFRPEKWPEIVKLAAGIMSDCGLVPACTLITGLPQETDEDVIKSIELIEDLKWFKSLIVPLFFVPMGRLRDGDWFRAEQLTPLQIELLLKCLQHDLKWAKAFMDEYLGGKWYRPILKLLYWALIWAVERRARKEGILEARLGIGQGIKPSISARVSRRP
ncbi:MAG: radical SAM protein [Candidatus Bathyarchaeia archaeon]